MRGSSKDAPCPSLPAPGPQPPVSGSFSAFISLSLPPTPSLGPFPPSVPLPAPSATPLNTPYHSPCCNPVGVDIPPILPL